MPAGKIHPPLLLLQAIFLTALPAQAVAHNRAIPDGVATVVPADVLQRWELDPLIIFSLLLLSFLYAFGLHRLWRNAHTGAGIRIWESLSFLLGVIFLFIALISPLHALGELLFSAHMTQHEVLMLICAPLLVLGRPLLPFLWALSPQTRRKFGGIARWRWFQCGWRFISDPLSAFAIHGAILWFWHIPSLFEATLHSRMIHAAQHMSFLISALLFWWSVIHSRSQRYGVGVFFLFLTSIHSGTLGALLTFARTAFYPAYVTRAELFGFTALEDQQLGGLIMWIPAALVYVFAAMVLMVCWLRSADKLHAI